MSREEFAFILNATLWAVAACDGEEEYWDQRGWSLTPAEKKEWIANEVANYSSSPDPGEINYRVAPFLARLGQLVEVKTQGVVAEDQLESALQELLGRGLIDATVSRLAGAVYRLSIAGFRHLGEQVASATSYGHGMARAQERRGQDKLNRHDLY